MKEKNEKKQIGFLYRKDPRRVISGFRTTILTSEDAHIDIPYFGIEKNDEKFVFEVENIKSSKSEEGRFISPIMKEQLDYCWLEVKGRLYRVIKVIEEEEADSYSVFLEYDPERRFEDLVFPRARHLGNGRFQMLSLYEVAMPNPCGLRSVPRARNHGYLFLFRKPVPPMTEILHAESHRDFDENEIVMVIPNWDPSAVVFLPSRK